MWKIIEAIVSITCIFMMLSVGGLLYQGNLPLATFLLLLIVAIYVLRVYTNTVKR